jgi:hypothetical protein
MEFETITKEEVINWISGATFSSSEEVITNLINILHP